MSNQTNIVLKSGNMILLDNVDHDNQKAINFSIKLGKGDVQKDSFDNLSENCKSEVLRMAFLYPDLLEKLMRSGIIDKSYKNSKNLNLWNIFFEFYTNNLDYFHCYTENHVEKILKILQESNFNVTTDEKLIENLLDYIKNEKNIFLNHNNGYIAEE